jgi:3-deoxy-D-manno-octulosonic-acid transferase
MIVNGLHGGQTARYSYPLALMYAVYSAFIVAVLIVMSPVLLYGAIRHRKYFGSLQQRLGRLPVSFNLDGEESIWIHAVSVGEVLSARALLPDLRARYPRYRLYLSTTTKTGRQIAARSLVQYVDEVFYVPFDLGFAVRRTLRVVRPKFLILIETEIWPNLLRACHEAGVVVALVNGRISTRSYPRYRLARPFFRRVLRHIDVFCMQSEESARRIIDIGAPADRVTVTGSLKFDSLQPAAVPGEHAYSERGQSRVLRYFRVSPDRPVVIAASTLRGEEDPVLDAFQRLSTTRSNALLILAPRKPERFDDAERLARKAGYTVARRSELRVDAEPRQQVIILDSIGELAQLFQIATVVFVGGSLVDAGGHNILEPAVFGKPIIFGPYMQNFAEIASTFLEQGAAVQIRSPRELEPALLELLGDPVRRASLGAAARALVEANRGAREQTMTRLAERFDPPAASNVRPFRVVR